MRLDHLLSKEGMSRELSYYCVIRERMAGELLVAMRSGGTPVPIPNTTVKTGTAEGTALETVWENRWPPDQKKKARHREPADAP